MKAILLFSGLLLTITTTIPVVKAGDFNDFQLQRLNAPTEHQVLAEAKGKIYIYEGLTVNQVDTALDNNFERMDAMMFTRIVQRDKNGIDIIEDDGCD